MTRKVLVTGDKGYIGSVIVAELLKRNYQVLGFDTDYYASGMVPGYAAPQSYRSVKKDIRTIERKDLDGVDGIIHLCALSNDPMGDLDEKLTEDINYASSVRLAEIAKKTGVRSFLFSSSCSIYGKSSGGTVDETCPTNPLTAYARSKIMTERDLATMASPDFFVGLLRNSTVYGFSPKFRDDLVVNNLVVNALLTGEIRVMSDGSPWRPLIDVRDLSNMFIRFLETADSRINGKVVNVGFNENNFQVKDLAACIHEQLPECPVRFTGEHGADSRSYKVSFDLLHKIFGSIKQEWTLAKSVADLIVKLRTLDPVQLRDKRFTRIHTLKELIDQNKLTDELYWRK